MFKRVKESLSKKADSLKHLSYLSLNNIIASFAGLGSVIILANSLTQEQYGIYKYIYSICGFLGVLSLSGSTRTVVIQSVSRGYDGVVNHLHKINPILNAPMAIGALATSFYYYFNNNEIIAYSVFIVALSNIALNDAIIGTSWFNGRKKFKELFYYQTITSFVSLITLVICILWTKNLLIIIVVNSISAAAMSMATFYYVRGRVRNIHTDTKVLQYGKHLNFLNIISTIMQYIDSVLVFHFLGAKNLALYAMAIPLIDRITGFFKISYFFALPKFTAHGPRKARQSLNERSLYAFFIGLLIIVIYYFLAPIFFKNIFPKYIGSISISIWYSLNIPLVALSILPGAYIDSLIEVRNKYLLQAVSFTVRITSLIVFIQLYGILGAIWSELLTRVSVLVVVFLIIKRHNKKAELYAK